MKRHFGSLLRSFAATKTAPQPTVKPLTADNVKKSRYLEFCITEDLYRIDIGFLLIRPPIIDDVSETEMKRRIAAHKFKKQNNLYPRIDESLMEFEISDPL